MSNSLVADTRPFLITECDDRGDAGRAGADVDGPSRSAANRSRGRRVAAAVLAAALVLAVSVGMGDASLAARMALLAFGGALIGWVVLQLDDVRVALVACLALVAAGTVPAEALYRSLGSEMIWLLLSAFVLAHVLQGSGLAERAARAAVGGTRSATALFHRLNWVIGASAFVIPSTSARAAMLLPVFVILARAVGDPRLVRGLALLFPTSILLTAGASLLGAGAHLVAVQFIERETGLRIGFFHWAVLAIPFAAMSSTVATAVILRLFLGPTERSRSLVLPMSPADPVTREQRGVLIVAAATVGLWCVAPWLGLDTALIALVGALLATTPAITGASLPKVLKSLEWGLLLFLAATTMMGDVLIDSGAAAHLTGLALDAVPLADGPAWLPLCAAAIIAVAMHLVVPSRTARAVVLLPTVVLPFAAAGADAALLAFICVQGTGFCQTFTASAKPLAVFGRAGDLPDVATTFGAGDLLRLSALLGPLVAVLLMVFALAVWPALGLGPAG